MTEGKPNVQDGRFKAFSVTRVSIETLTNTPLLRIGSRCSPIRVSQYKTLISATHGTGRTGHGPWCHAVCLWAAGSGRAVLVLNFPFAWASATAIGVLI